MKDLNEEMLPNNEREQSSFLLRVSNIKTARQVAMFLLSKELGMSTPKIASEVGVKDHTTVMHGVKKIDSDIKFDFVLRDQIDEIKERIYG